MQEVVNYVYFEEVSKEPEFREHKSPPPDRSPREEGVYLEMLRAEFATEELVLLPHVLLQLLKPGEDFWLRTARALWRQQMSDPKTEKKNISL